MKKNCNIRNQFWPLTSLLFFIFLLFSLKGSYAREALNFSKLETRWLCHAKGKIKAYLAQTNEQRRIGLSNSKSSAFTPFMTLYFVYKQIGSKRFWMPEMNFPLDIIFLDKEQKIIGIERNVPAASAGTPRKKIPTTHFYQAKDVLELRINSPWGKRLKLGDQLNWCH